MILQPQDVAGTTSGEVESHPGTEQHVVGTVEFDEVFGDQVESCRFGPPQRLHVAETTVAVLQVGFEPIGDVAGRVLTHAHAVPKRFEMAFAVATPQRQSLLDDLRGQFVVAGQRARRDQCGGGVEVGGGEVELLVDAADGMAQLHARVPERIPDRTGERFDLLGHLPRLDVVDEQEVEVALRGQLAASVPSDRQQRHPTTRDD